MPISPLTRFLTKLASLHEFRPFDLESSFVKGEGKMHRFRTGLVYDERLSRHYNVWNTKFAEMPERVTEPFAVCQKYNLVDQCLRVQCREATEAEMLMKHSRELVEKLKETQHMTEEELKSMSQKYDFIYFHPMIYENSRLALGGCLDLVQAVLREEVQNGMAIIRPPGHHGQYDLFCGYCYLNNVATAAQMALDEFKLQRILIVDWDVHHGQGTQYMFYDDPRVLFISIHNYAYGREWPYLRESDYDFIGTGPGKGYSINIPLNQLGCGNEEYMAIFQQLILPIAYEFSPELVLVSAGFDSAIGCPEGRMEVTPAMYAHFISLLSTLAGGKICLLQEGGYCIKSLAESMALSLRALLGHPTPLVQTFRKDHPNESVVEAILNATKMLRPYWKCLQFQEDLRDDPDGSDNPFLSLPPRPDVNFYTDNMPEAFDLFQPCYDEAYENKKAILYERIDDLIAHTNLGSAKHQVCIVTDSRMLLHRDISSSGSEETGDRISACCETLRAAGLWQRCHEVESRQATFEELCLAHGADYVKLVSRTSTLSEESVLKYQNTFDSVYLCQDTYLASSTAVGCLLNVVDSVLSGESQSGVAIIRPPGHHAISNSAHGFCVFNNNAIAAKYIQRKYPNKRILIVDWDLHHGNGIQEMFYEDTSVLYISVHRHDKGKYFPCGKGGSYTQCGRGSAKGYNINIAWNNGKRGDGDYISAFQQVVMPVAYQFGPDIVLVAAGFDACAGDVLGGSYEVTPDCFGHLTQMLKTLANGHLILALEGGYSLESTSSAMKTCLSVMLGDSLPQLPSVIPSPSGVVDIKNVLDIHKRFWPGLKFRVALPTMEQLQRTTVPE